MMPSNAFMELRAKELDLVTGLVTSFVEDEERDRHCPYCGRKVYAKSRYHFFCSGTDCRHLYYGGRFRPRKAVLLHILKHRPRRKVA